MVADNRGPLAKHVTCFILFILLFFFILLKCPHLIVFGFFFLERSFSIAIQTRQILWLYALVQDSGKYSEKNERFFNRKQNQDLTREIFHYLKTDFL